MPDRFDQLIDNYWNNRNLSGQPQIDIDADLAASIETMHNLYAVTPPASSRERIRQRVLDLSDTAAKEYTMSAMTLPADLPATNGRMRPAVRITKPKLVSTRNRTKWALASLAAALIILLGGIGGYLVLDNRNESSAPALSPAQQATPDTDWPMYRGNPGRTGVMPGTGPKTMPGEVWRVQLDGSANRSPIVVGDTAYVGTSQGTLYALDAATGVEKWQFKGDGGLEMTPAYLNGVVFIPSNTGTLFAIDASSGQEKWRFAKPLAAFATPTFGDGLLFAASETDDHIYGIDPATGAEVWSYEASSPVDRGQAYDNGVVFSGSVGGILYAVNATDGAELWQLDLNQDGLGTVTVANGVVYATAPGGVLVLVDAATGAELQRIQTPSPEGTTPITVTEDRLYTGGRNGSVLALDIATGEVTWSVPTSDIVPAAVALVDGVVYAVAIDGKLYALDAEKGDPLWTYTLDGEVNFGPHVTRGMVFASTAAGTVIALGDAPASATQVSPASPEAVTAASDVLATEVVWQTAGAASSPLAVPLSVGIAQNGNIYLVNGVPITIEVFNPDGDPLETWGSPGSEPGQFQFNSLGDIDFDADGNVYVFDTNNHRIQKFSPDHAFLLEWGSQGNGDGQFDEVLGSVDAASGRVFATDLNNRVQVFDLEGNFLFAWGAEGSGEGQFRKPTDIAFDSQGNVYVVEEEGRRVQKFAPDGAFLDASTPIGSMANSSLSMFAVAIDSNDNLFLADWNTNRIEVLRPDGSLAGTIEVPVSSGASHISGVVIDDQGNLYVADEGTNRLLKLQLPPLE